MRGIVMILMVSDHASEAFNAARPVTDSVLFPGWDRPLPGGPFLYRWLSHLCAPVFLFLAGTSLALSSERRRSSAHTKDWSIDRDLAIRGTFIVILELAFINYFWFPRNLLLQVLYAIGVSMILMIPLRRLPPRVLIAAGITILVACEWTATGKLAVGAEPYPAFLALSMNAGFLPIEIAHWKGVFSAYPVLPWTAVMLFGWVFGAGLSRHSEGKSRRSFLLGGLCLVLFVVLRGLNGFGNLGLPRLDHSVVQWLHVSKYPPSLTFVALEMFHNSSFHFIETLKVRAMSRNISSGDVSLYFANKVQNKRK